MTEFLACKSFAFDFQCLQKAKENDPVETEFRQMEQDSFASAD